MSIPKIILYVLLSLFLCSLPCLSLYVLLQVSICLFTGRTWTCFISLLLIFHTLYLQTTLFNLSWHIKLEGNFPYSLWIGKINLLFSGSTITPRALRCKYKFFFEWGRRVYIGQMFSEVTIANQQMKQTRKPIFQFSAVLIF